ncbi:uncharacterized protein LOC112572759 [Pomacea canaliculata]|uniref:uncharacterized protein LOC112572759 n=1 Tax=Pomacea canaliculata TaxID=400727 RepID=UPI000D73B522|nr:uncharacterized protein LOC112572759 [Pomacea canaliculata]
MQHLRWHSDKSSSGSCSYSEKSRVRQNLPSYRILGLLAILFNPPLGVVVYFLNRAAVRNAREGNGKRAERLYFSTIVLGITSIVLTLTVVAEVVIWAWPTSDLQADPCVVADAAAKRARLAKKSLTELCKTIKIESLGFNEELEKRRIG